MYAITGITGRVGGAAAQVLLDSGQSVRGIVRNTAKASDWKEKGVELFVVDSNDAEELKMAFMDVEGVFIMIPPYFAPQPGFPEARAVVAALQEALIAANPPKIVCLLSIGAQQSEGLGLITQLHILEQELGSLPIPSAFVRGAWFMENSEWDVPVASDTGEMPSFLYPLDKAFPMIATIDIGIKCAELLQESWTGKRIIEIEAVQRYSPNDIAGFLSDSLEKPVQAVMIPEEKWASIFEGQGAEPQTIPSRIEMLKGFNSDWIEFERQNTKHVLGQTPMENIIAALVRNAR